MSRYVDNIRAELSNHLRRDCNPILARNFYPTAKLTRYCLRALKGPQAERDAKKPFANAPKPDGGANG